MSMRTPPHLEKYLIWHRSNPKLLSPRNVLYSMQQKIIIIKKGFSLSSRGRWTNVKKMDS